MKIKQIADTTVDSFPRRRFILTSSLVLLLYTAAVSLLRTNVFLLNFPESGLFTLGFGFGPLVENLLTHGQYGVNESAGGYVLSAHRMPLIPVFLSVAGLVSKNLYFVFLIKNILFNGMLGACLIWLALARRFKLWVFLLLAFLCFLLPSIAWTAAHIEYEEGYTTQLLAGFFALLCIDSAASLVACAVLLSILYLAKSSNFLLYFVFTAVVLKGLWTKETAKPQLLVAMILLVLVPLGWGTFQWNNSGRFAFAQNSSSWNGWNLYKGNNEKTIEYYPKRSLDLLEEEFGGPLHRTRDDEGNTFSDEWQAHDYWYGRAKQYMREHPADTVMNFLSKKWVFMFECGLVGRLSDEQAPDNLGMITHLVGKPLMWLSVAIALSSLFVKRLRSYRRISLFYITLLVTYSAPFLIGFCYQRHCYPVLLVSFVFLAVVVNGLSSDSGMKREQA